MYMYIYIFPVSQPTIKVARLNLSSRNIIYRHEERQNNY